MSNPYVGEIRMFAGNFAPAGWMFCEGQLLPISENEILFQLIGTTYGGDGEETFALPNLSGRLPMHYGNGIPLAQASGVEEVTLTINQIPSHTHSMLASSGSGASNSPLGNVIGEQTTINLFIEDNPNVSLAATAIAPVGGSQPHTNMQPYLCVNFIISLFGVFPSPT